MVKKKVNHATADSIEHQLDIAADRALVRKEDFEAFVFDQNSQHAVLNDKLDDLTPLRDLVPDIKTMVKNQEALSRSSKWLVGILSLVSLFIGIIFTLYRAVTGKW